MKTKLITGIIIVLVASLTILILIKKEPKTIIITVPKIYAILKTDDTEHAKIALLTNNSDSYLFDIDFIQNSKVINGLSDHVLPIEINDIQKMNEYYFYNDIEYEVINIVFQVVVESDTLKEELPNANLMIQYQNNKELMIEIGSFNYMSSNDLSNDISLSNLYATHGELNGVDTVTGVYIELDNVGDRNAKILSIDTISNDIFLDNHQLTVIEHEPMISSTPASIFQITSYSHFKVHSIFETNILLAPNQSKKLYVPLLYNSDIQHVYRFPLIVTYMINDQIKQMIVDDFPYINTAPFKQSLESEFVVYEFTN